MADTLMVIVSYNNYTHTINAIESLLNQTVPVRIVVWDNHSTDGSVEQLQAYKPCDEIKLVLSEENLLWTPAINKSIEQFYDGETYIGFMNNDIIVPPMGIALMIETLNKPNVGMVAPVGSHIGGPQDYAANKEKWLAEGKGTEDDFIAQGAGRVTYVVGACVLLSKAVWDEVGPLDEDMPLGADDHDYAIRLKEAGYEIWVNYNVYVQHVGHASGAAPEWDIYGVKSWERFNDKWAGYYATQEEARLCHWEGVYTPGWDKGTGWISKNGVSDASSLA